MPEFRDYFVRYVPSLEAEMRDVVRGTDSRQSELYGMLHYHLGWADAAFNPCQTQTGKRVRPVLCLLTCESCGGDWEQALPAAVAIELLHNFSLIHDDIEDQDRVRRGRPTVWSLWGQAQAINAGDTLFALAQLALLRLSERGVPAERVVAAHRLFSQTCVALTGGQYLDIGFEDRDDISVVDYLAMVEGKTAALIACACEMGAIVAAVSAPYRKHLHSFGRHLGLAFQIRDDILGIWGDPDVTGKPVGADIVRRKKTLPILHGLEQSVELRALLARGMLSTTDVHRATHLLQQTNSREYTEQLLHEYHVQAMAVLEQANLQGPSAYAFQELAKMLLNREM